MLLAVACFSSVQCVVPRADGADGADGRDARIPTRAIRSYPGTT